jgi:hypothetical protein
VLVHSFFLHKARYSYVKPVSRYTKIVAMLYYILLYITFSSVHRFTDDRQDLLTDIIRIVRILVGYSTGPYDLCEGN